MCLQWLSHVHMSMLLLCSREDAILLAPLSMLHHCRPGDGSRMHHNRQRAGSQPGHQGLQAPSVLRQAPAAWQWKRSGSICGIKVHPELDVPIFKNHKGCGRYLAAVPKLKREEARGNSAWSSEGAACRPCCHQCAEWREAL